MTPEDFFQLVRSQLGPFDVDVCATKKNTKVRRFFSPEVDGLKQDWTKHQRCWMNPPYGRRIKAWVEKAFVTGNLRGYVVALLPARTDTSWFHLHVRPVLEGDAPGRVHFVRGRLKFGKATTGALFPSMLVEFGRRPGGSRSKAPLRLRATEKPAA